MTPDPERIKAINELSEPINKKQLQSFLGMVNYLRNFIPNLSEMVVPFRELLKKNVLWQWNSQCQLAFCKFKEKLGNLCTLKHFESKCE